MSCPQNVDIVHYEIVLRDPESLLRKQLGDDLRVESFETESFIKSEDHFGSTIMKLRAVVKRGGRDEEVMELVGKMLPPTDYQRKLFESNYTFKKEMFVYEELMPLYRRLYKKKFDVTPGFYGARLSLRPDADEVDEDAVILMENLKVKGYYMVDRHKGLDQVHMKSVIISLAKFHAVGMSIKHKDPEFLPIMQKYMRPLILDDAIMRPYTANVLEILKNDSVTGQYYSRFRATLISNDLNETYYHPIDAKNPWSSMIHSDFWGNNVLFHNDEAGNVDDAKIVDFQMSYMASPLLDVVFLLCTSMATLSVEHFDEMLELYRVSMLGDLKELGCDTGLFERESFEERLKIDAAEELLHIVLMIKVVGRKEDEDIDICPANEFCKRRFRWIMQIYGDKGWI